jgi:tetratricopeptide (TPR) repeat protein
MGWHFPFDRTERCLTRGQQALARRDFPIAEAILRDAVRMDPGYAHIHLYLAHALAEQERVADAEAELRRAAELAPDNFVFPLHLAIVWLDVDRRAAAREALARAAALAPDNALVAGYRDLIAWEDGAADTLVPLGRRARELPESFRARLLLRLAAATLEGRGGKGAVALLEPPPETPLGIPLPAGLRARWRRGRVAHARRLLEAGRPEDAADYLAAQPDALDEPGARDLLERARRGAVTVITTALEDAEPRARRALLLRRYEYDNDLGDRDAAYRTLQAWLAAYRDAGASSSETPVAEAAARRLAELDVERGDYERALQHCAASRAARPARETHGVEALALLGLGRRRPARHRFEDFLADALFPIEVAVARALESAAWRLHRGV